MLLKINFIIQFFPHLIIFQSKIFWYIYFDSDHNNHIQILATPQDANYDVIKKVPFCRHWPQCVQIQNSRTWPPWTPSRGSIPYIFGCWARNSERLLSTSSLVSIILARLLILLRPISILLSDDESKAVPATKAATALLQHKHNFHFTTIQIEPVDSSSVHSHCKFCRAK